MENEKLTYVRMNNSDDVVTIDLHNGYSVMAVSGWDRENHRYIVTLYISKNGYDCWKIVEGAEKIEITGSYRTVHPIILKKVATMNDSGFFESHIKRYEFMLACVDSFYKLLEQAQEDDE